MDYFLLILLEKRFQGNELLPSPPSLSPPFFSFRILGKFSGKKKKEKNQENVIYRKKYHLVNVLRNTVMSKLFFLF